MAGKKTTKKSRAAKKTAPKKARKAPAPKAVKGGRGSPEAVEKRRVARRLNAMLTSDAPVAIDGRTLRKRDRIVADLKDKQLKPVEVLIRISDLMAMGETTASIKKMGVRPIKTSFSADTPEIRAAVAQVQEAYNFPPAAWRFIGVTLGSEATEEAAQAAE